MLNHSVEKDNSDFKTSSHAGGRRLPDRWHGADLVPLRGRDGQADDRARDGPDETGELRWCPPSEYEAIMHEDCLTEYVFWEDFWWSPARTWDECAGSHAACS